MSAQLLLLQSFAIRDVIRSWGGAVHRETANKNSVVLDLLKKKKSTGLQLVLAGLSISSHQWFKKLDSCCKAGSM